MTHDLLIIDDDIDDCQLLEESLYQIGTIDNIAFRHNIRTALEFLEEHKDNLPKVVIIDVNLPIVDGMSGLKSILAQYAVTAIMYTTSCTPEMKNKALNLGAIDCVQKGSTYADNMKFAKRVFDLIHKGAVRQSR